MSGAELLKAFPLAASYEEPIRTDDFLHLKGLAGEVFGPRDADAPGCSTCRRMRLDHLAARTGGLSAGPARSLLPERVPVTVLYIGVPISVGYIAHVHSSGLVCRISVLVSSGHEKVDMAGLRVVKRWRFQPTMLEGKPVESYYTGAFTYRPLP